MRRICSLMLLGPALGALAACGGGGGGGSNLVSTPPPPPPPPPSSVPVNIFPSITQSTEFAVLGIETGLATDGFAVRYDAVSNSYIFDLPTHAPAAFHDSATTPSDAAYWNGGLVSSTTTILWPPMSVLKPSATNPLIQLEHTSYASYWGAGPMEDLPHGVVAFGTATPSAGIPTTGTATMHAIVAGQTDDRFSVIGGTATLQFDFSAGTLAGSFNPILYPFYDTNSHPLGEYTFVNTIYGVGSTSFSGEFAHSNTALTGAFNGLFTGPAAQEMMARWSADYFVQGITSQPEKMFGIWVGKKCC